MGKDAGHFVTERECNYCHDNNFWTPLLFSHFSAAYPGDHSSPLLCTACHGGNSETVTWPSPQYQPDCASCHADEFEPDHHKIYENPDTFYNLDQLRDCNGACHMYTDSSLTTIEKNRPGPEHRVTDGDF
jgi:hypothetical protein